MSTQSQELTPAAQESAQRMLATIEDRRAQYAELLPEGGPAVQAMASLVLRSAEAGVELSPAAVDYAVESFGRHGISQEELLALGDPTELTAPEAEVHLRRIHVALEIIRGHVEPPINLRGPGLAEWRVRTATQYFGLIEAIESASGEVADDEMVLQVAEEYRHFLETSAQESDDDEEATVRDGALSDLVNDYGSARKFWEFLADSEEWSGEVRDPDQDDDELDED